MIITVDTDPDELEELYESSSHISGLAIDPELDRATLESIARKHNGRAHGDVVLDCVIAHPACDAALLELCLELAESGAVVNSVVTSGKAPRSLLERMAESDASGVREHAEFALLDLDYRAADDAGKSELLRRFRDHPSLGYGFRYRVAYDPDAPREAIELLAKDDDAPGERARARLREPG